MAPDGIAEVIIGGKRDPQFGPTVLFGLGGVFVEVFKDVSLRVAPVNHTIALKMIQEIKGYTILKGFRGKQGADIDALADMLGDRVPAHDDPRRRPGAGRQSGDRLRQRRRRGRCPGFAAGLNKVLSGSFAYSTAARARVQRTGRFTRGKPYSSGVII